MGWAMTKGKGRNPKNSYYQVAKKKTYSLHKSEGGEKKKEHQLVSKETPNKRGWSPEELGQRTNERKNVDSNRGK